jgi:hypothetical protein
LHTTIVYYPYQFVNLRLFFLSRNLWCFKNNADCEFANIKHGRNLHINEIWNIITHTNFGSAKSFIVFGNTLKYFKRFKFPNLTHFPRTVLLNSWLWKYKKLNNYISVYNDIWTFTYPDFSCYQEAAGGGWFEIRVIWNVVLSIDLKWA